MDEQTRRRKKSAIEQPLLYRFPEDLIVRETVPGQDTSQELEDILHSKIKFDVNYYNDYGHTALGTSAFVGSLKCCQILVHLGAEVTKKDADGWTALHYALARGYLDIARYLILNGGNLFSVNSDGERALDFVDDEEIKLSLSKYQEQCSQTRAEL
ncbi:protein phosphatase 1 regulatory subunit 27-like [Actinia tenebrosa]|uniref:Protein phosphatase 1 regulatory subunit 27-like n=1 Tax=Actinia tenebrosa TaxID=6105 RepID=A0A6P8ILC8_ACTTE|nr:protein phosphatase 1 regulatory subunit 27-like [Actinia tenebrosa]